MRQHKPEERKIHPKTSSKDFRCISNNSLKRGKKIQEKEIKEIILILYSLIEQRKGTLLVFGKVPFIYTYPMSSASIRSHITTSPLLYGVEIDYTDAGMGGGFSINNPNAVASCGCGPSFKVKDEEGLVEKCDDKVEA
ncbi:hypothetical protein LOZ80_00795 [Paenibacillus sp. HWE-109]|uniref:HesB/IscA family protein n=1 Tax=Paenibacillus sp. HWE-109 TaxID=1306526 RepID=UPI001EDCD72C|nr:hypothetical protein [Paenibacillus sp. HWE-109]UKS27522.1 hypothetical protein LOZ80_00795 [Paenibacillus sp. HWE-109]